jgi:PqqD family protein of HPr-rel-A system
MTITDQSVVAAAQDPVSTELGGERVLLHPETGQYHGLSDVAYSIWENIQEPVQVNEVHEALLEEYAVDPDECRQDLLAFLEELRAAQLVTVE